MLRVLLNQSLVYGLSNAASRAVALLLVPFYTRVFGPSELGAIDLITVIGNLANVIVAVEISQAVARFYPRTDDPDERSSYASTGFWMTFCAYSCALAVAIAFAEPIALWVFEADGSGGLLRVALCALWTTGVFYFLQNQLRWQLAPVAHALASLAFTLVSASLAVGLIVGAGMGVEGVFWGQIAGGIAGGLVALRAIGPALRLRFDAGKLSQMLAFSAPLAVSSLAAIATGQVDRILVKELLSVADLGVYSVAQRLAAMVSLVVAGFQVSVTPLVTHLARDPGTPRQLARMLRWFLVGALASVLALALLARELLTLLATPQFYSGHVVVPILGAATLLGAMYVFAPGLWLAGRTRTTMVVYLVTAGVSLGLNLLAVPRFGLPGAALATLASSALAFGTLTALGQRHFAVPMSWRPALTATLLVLAIGWAGSLLGAPSATTTAARLLLLVGGSIAILLIVVGRDELESALERLRAARRSIG